MHFKELKKQGLPAELLGRGTPYSIDYLRDKNERIEWAVLAQIMNNLSKVWPDEEFVRQGGSFFAHPFMRPFSLVGRFLFEPRAFYAYLNRPNSGMGNQLFSCITPSLRDVGDNALEVTLLLPDGYPYCRQFFLCTKGAMEQLPRFVGQPPARVEMREVERGAVYNIEYDSATSTLGKIRQAVERPFVAAGMAKELQEAHHTLTKRYNDLEKTQAVVDQQAKQLRTAFKISELVHGDVRIDSVLTVVAQALVEVPEFVAAHVELTLIGLPGTDNLVASAGAPSDEEDLIVPLESGDRTLGTLRLWRSPDADERACRRLLNHVVPTITMAIKNAEAFATVENYRDNLEAMVAERTRELGEARDTLSDTVDRLEHVQATRDRLFANVNHELRTPLANVVLAIQKLKSDYGDTVGETGAAVIDAVQLNVDQLLHLMDGLLLLAEGHSGELTLRREPTRVAQLCELVCTSWRPAAERARVELALELQDDIVMTLDRDGMVRALGNLISNALKHTPDGGRIAVHLRREDDTMVAEVRDSGVGISEELKSRLFGRFEKGPPPPRSLGRGTGIGLAIVKEIIEAHGGVVSTESPASGGAVFAIRVPIDRVDHEPQPVEALMRATPVPSEEDVEPPPPSNDTRRTTVVVAEDDPELRHAIADLLSEEHRVFAAENGAVALELAAEHHPDLLVTDLAMPVMDGHELAKRFRELPGKPLAPVIMLTAHARHKHKRHAFEAGAIDYILKPFDPEELKYRVGAQLRQQELAVRLSETEKLSSLAVLSAGLAHEFRNPANGIVNATELLKECLSELSVDNDTEELIDVIGSCGEQIRSLCSQVLGFAGEGRLKLTTESVPALLEQTQRLAAGAVGDTEVRVEMRYTGEVRCAGPFLVQALVNLLENAAHAAGDDGWVQLSTFVENDCVHFRVTDNGPGISDALRQKILQPFFTTKAPGAGTGLGLPVVQRIVEQHGGRLTILHADKGAAVELVVPLKDELAA